MPRGPVKQDKPAKSFDDLADIIRGGRSVRLDDGTVVTTVSALRRGMGRPSAPDEDGEDEGGATEAEAASEPLLAGQDVLVSEATATETGRGRRHN